MGGFLEFILYCVLGFYLLGYLARFLLGLWVRRMQKRYEQNPNRGNFRAYTWGNGHGFGARGAAQNQQQEQQKKQEGEVTIKTQEQQKRVNKNIGEYVDFEEIKEPTDPN